MDVADLTKRWLNAVETGDLEGVRATVDPDVTVWHNFDRADRVGVETMLAGVAELSASVKDLRFAESRCDVFDNGFVQRHVMRGTTAAGVEMDLPSCIVGTVRNDRIVRLEEYLDLSQVPPLNATAP